MQIGVDARLMHHQPAGISRYTWHLLRALSDLDHTDLFTIFQHRKHGEPLIERPNFRRSTLYAPVHTRLEQFLLPIELFRFQLDILHATDFIPPLHSPVPTVITVHDLAFLHWPHFLTSDSAAYYGQIDKAVRQARHIIVPSESTQQDLIGQLGVPADKVSVIYEAADARFVPLPIETTRHEIRTKFAIPDRYVLFVGTIEPRKNVSGLLHAFRHLLDRYHISDVGLVIAGGLGWLHEEILALIEQLDLKQQTFLLGRVADEDLHKLYVGARCHVHPAHYEGFGLPPLEAMACGTPTIVSNISSLPEVVGDAALLISPDNWEEIAVALHRLLTNEELHGELRQKGLLRASGFSWQLAASKTLEVYRNVVESRSTHATTHSRSSTRQTNGL